VPTTTVRYVEYQYLSYTLSGPSSEEIKTRNKKRCAEQAPNGVVSFHFFDITITNGVRSEPQNVSPEYYIDAELLNADTIKTLPGNHGDILKEMRRKGLDVALRCRTGIFVEPPSSYVLLKAA